MKGTQVKITFAFIMSPLCHIYGVQQTSTDEYLFILPPNPNTQPMCLICSERVAVFKGRRSQLCSPVAGKKKDKNQKHLNHILDNSFMANVCFLYDRNNN